MIMESGILKVAVSFFLGGFVGLVTITNPLSKIPLFLSLTSGVELRHARKEARRACVYALVLLTVFLFAGVLVLETFGISYGALRIAGGITVGLIGHRMLFGTADSLAGGRGQHDSFAFFPLAMPGIAGPGALATVIGISTEIAELPGGELRAFAYASTVFAIVLTCLLMLGIFRSAHFASRWLGSEGINVISRLTGFLLVCIGVQFVASGIRSFIAGT